MEGILLFLRSSHVLAHSEGYGSFDEIDFKINNHLPDFKAACIKWREITGIMCDRKMPGKLKGKICETQVRPVLLYGTVSWAVVKKDEDLMSRTEMRMLRWLLGVSRLEKLRNEEVRRRCGVADIIEKMREARLRWM